MALNAPSKAGRGRPTIGRKIAAHVPLPAGKKAAERNYDKTDQLFARLYAKDSVINFLGLPLANYRKLLTSPPGIGVDLPQQGNKVIRAVADKVSAREYTIILQPGTLVQQAQYKWYLGENPDDGSPDSVELKSLSFSLPAYMPVWRILDWLAGQMDTYQVGTGQSEALPGMDFTNYNKIIALVTPSQRTYPLESILYTNRVPPPIPTALDAPGTPQTP